MIKRDGSGTSGTSWQSYDVARIWDLVKDHHTDNHWKQVAGWRKTYELTQTHMSRLKQYRAGLVEAWPPGKSEAAGLYIAHLDHLIENVQQAYDTAQANYTTLSAATMAISQTREKVRKLYDEYALKRQQKQEYDQRVAADRDSLLPGTSTGKPPVTDAELERLNESARGLMVGLSGELVEARVQIRQPPPYKDRIIRDPGQDGDLKESPTPPVIPPIVAVGGSTARPLAPAPSTSVQVPTPTAPGNGPVLGGASPSITAPAPTGPTAPSVTMPSPGSIGSSGGMLPPFSTSPGTTSPFNPAAGNLNRPATGGVTGAPRAMPPGGLIGGTPGVGLGQPGAGSPGRRTNPVGGVIGNNTKPATAPTGSGRGKGHHLQGDEATHRWDPDTPWATAEGVSPVVLPLPDPGRIDPGPAIGYSR